MHHIYLQKLNLENYRNFKDLTIEAGNEPIILIGENGSGKTNILEAISLFSPGKGIRGAKLDDLCRRDENSCSMQTLLHSKLGTVELSTRFSRQVNKRSILFNGTKIPNNELSNFSSMIWLTPQMEGVFTAGLSDRRKFFDRIVYNITPSHATLISKYEYYVYERNNVLTHNQRETNWLTVIEEKIAELSLEIASNRLKTLTYIQKAINELDNEFPKAILAIEGVVETNIAQGRGNILEFIKIELFNMRNRDKMSGRTNFGVHKSDFVVTHQGKNALAKFCSTGEQKAMLIAILLAQVNYAIRENITKPIMLLDEVFVHLDNRRKQYLINFLVQSGMQLWITATDISGIESLVPKAQLIKLADI